MLKKKTHSQKPQWSFQNIAQVPSLSHFYSTLSTPHHSQWSPSSCDLAPASLQSPILPLSASFTLFQSHCPAVAHTRQACQGPCPSSFFWLEHSLQSSPSSFSYLIQVSTKHHLSERFPWPNLEHTFLATQHPLCLCPTWFLTFWICLFILCQIPHYRGTWPKGPLFPITFGLVLSKQKDLK